MKKKLDKITKEHTLLKTRFAEQEKKSTDVNSQLQSSLNERIALEKSLVDISHKVCIIIIIMLILFK